MLGPAKDYMPYEIDLLKGGGLWQEVYPPLPLFALQPLCSHVYCNGRFLTLSGEPPYPVDHVDGCPKGVRPEDIPPF